ncbi:histidine phosphotransferase family protein [Paracoccus luteus]|uniref:histidine phosphotransferase family protein n=1 Tax=Paracoccus luteus TaxID=2508543 RepID=UPI001FEC524A|nr:histidine phosphotransferase family protein [Paracoccus luteus]
MKPAAIPDDADMGWMDSPARGLNLAALVGSRLCHDLISPLGAIGNGVELLEMSGDFPGIAKSPELSLIGESVEAARARIKLFRVAFGHAPADQRMGIGELAGLLSAYARGGRLTVEVDGTGDMSRADARLLSLAAMCMGSAMPWGGRLLVCRAGPGWRLVGEAARTRVDLPLWGWLDGRAGGHRPAPEPSEVHFPLLGLAAAESGRHLTWELDEIGAEIAF